MVARDLIEKRKGKSNRQCWLITVEYFSLFFGEENLQTCSNCQMQYVKNSWLIALTLLRYFFNKHQKNKKYRIKWKVAGDRFCFFNCESCITNIISSQTDRKIKNIFVDSQKISIALLHFIINKYKKYFTGKWQLLTSIFFYFVKRVKISIQKIHPHKVLLEMDNKLKLKIAMRCYSSSFS